MSSEHGDVAASVVLEGAARCGFVHGCCTSKPGYQETRSRGNAVKTVRKQRSQQSTPFGTVGSEGRRPW